MAEFTQCRGSIVVDIPCIYTQAFGHIKFVWIIDNDLLNLVWCTGIWKVIFSNRPHFPRWIQNCNPVLWVKSVLVLSFASTFQVEGYVSLNYFWSYLVSISQSDNRIHDDLFVCCKKYVLRYIGVSQFNLATNQSNAM